MWCHTAYLHCICHICLVFHYICPSHLPISSAHRICCCICLLLKFCVDTSPHIPQHNGAQQEALPAQLALGSSLCLLLHSYVLFRAYITMYIYEFFHMPMHLPLFNHMCCKHLLAVPTCTCCPTASSLLVTHCISCKCTLQHLKPEAALP